MKKLFLLFMLLAVGVFLMVGSAFRSATVPEPATILLVGLGGLSLLRRRRA